ncbi:MAG: hypothetical protein JW754_00070 [Candidatus Aenigmarchaeota archaeon]|nr:hypothetical protein [Candidatus Aenigmarchaeota archaeon]
MKKIKILTVLIFLFFVLGFLFGVQFNKTTVTVYNETKPIQKIVYTPFDSVANSSFSTIAIPAVDQEGEGLTTILTVQVVPGSGRVLANIDRLLFWTDTQNSIRTSRSVAAEVTGLNLSEYDIIYTIETNATSVEGPSAGTALTIATIAALQGKEIDTSILITGAINHDGTIGPVGEILQKAIAAKEAGYRLFLVPLMHSEQITYHTEKFCEPVGPSQICTTERIPDKISVEEEAGIRVEEVQDIHEALEYFLTD